VSWYGVLAVVLSLFFWIFGALCLRGLNKVLIAGFRKADACAYKERFDVISQNRYIGKTMFFPLAFFSSIVAILLLFDVPFFNSTWFSVAFSIAALVVTGLCMFSATQILGNRFKRRE